MSTKIEMIIATKKSNIAMIKDALKAHIAYQNYLVSVFEEEIAELNVSLDLFKEVETVETVDNDYPCYDCGRTINDCLCFEKVAKRAKFEET
jgi:hypothetical protein